MQIDVEQIGFTFGAVNDVVFPDLLGEGARHVVSLSHICETLVLRCGQCNKRHPGPRSHGRDPRCRRARGPVFAGRSRRGDRTAASDHASRGGRTRGARPLRARQRRPLRSRRPARGLGRARGAPHSPSKPGRYSPSSSTTTGESAQLYVREGDPRVCVAVHDRPSGLRDSVPLGAVMPLERGSGGKVLLAWADDRVRVRRRGRDARDRAQAGLGRIGGRARGGRGQRRARASSIDGRRCHRRGQRQRTDRTARPAPGSAARGGCRGRRRNPLGCHCEVTVA